MPSISRSIAVQPDVVWRLLTDLSAWPAWGPSVAGAVLDGAVLDGAVLDGEVPDGEVLELGSRGTVRTAVGVSLPFEVTEFVAGERWAWSVAGVPATDHRVSAADGGCTVTFGVPWWAPGYLAVCAIALRRIERLALGR